MQMGRPVVAMALALGLVSSMFAVAASAATRDEQTKACRGDAMRLCMAEIPNEQKITACMKSKLDQLSPGCRAMFGNQAKPKHPRHPRSSHPPSSPARHTTPHGG